MEGIRKAGSARWAPAAERLDLDFLEYLEALADSLRLSQQWEFPVNRATGNGQAFCYGSAALKHRIHINARYPSGLTGTFLFLRRLEGFSMVARDCFVEKTVQVGYWYVVNVISTAVNTEGTVTLIMMFREREPPIHGVGHEKCCV